MKENKKLNTVLQLISIVSSLFGGALVTLKFYQWFVQDIFFLPAISYPQAFGIFTFMVLFKNHNIPLIKNEYLKETELYRIIYHLLLPWIFLLTGYITMLCIK